MKFIRNYFSHRTLALLRWDFYFLKLNIISQLTKRNRKINKHILKMPKNKFLNLGSGPRGLSAENWVNVDGFKDENVHFVIDFNRPLPFDDNIFDGIFCEHVLEHFSFEDGNKLLKECYRILKPGGVVRFIFPDAEKLMKTYNENPTLLIERRCPKYGTAMEAINMYFYQRYEHQCLYDYSLSKIQFELAGFNDVAQSFYKTLTYSKTLLIDDEKYCWESLYIEAKK